MSPSASPSLKSTSVSAGRTLRCRGGQGTIYPTPPIPLCTCRPSVPGKRQCPRRLDQIHTIEGDNAALRQDRHSAALVIQVPPCPQSPYTLSRRSAVKPIGRRFGL